MQEKKIEPILAVKDHGGVFDVNGVLGSSTFAPIMTDIERMMQEKRIEPIVAVEDHGRLFDMALIFEFGLLENRGFEYERTEYENCNQLSKRSLIK